MIARTFALVACLSLSPALVPTSVPAQSDVEALVASEVAGAAGRDVHGLWQRALELRDAAELGEKGDLDRALDSWLRKGDELSPQATILLAAARLQGKGVDATIVADALAPLLEAGDAQLARAAGGLLSDEAFRSLAPKRRDGYARTLLERAEDGAVAPHVRLDFARAAWRLGGGRERIKTKQVLRSFLESQDPDLRAQGALATAELEAAPIEGPLLRTLQRLARLPDERGQLAASYLEREDRNRRDETVRRENRDRDIARERSPELVQFLTVLKLIQDRHLDGEKVDQDDLYLAAINGMLNYMDQHSALFTSEQYSKFFSDLEAEYGGIGAYVNNDPDDKLFTIVRPIYSGPAYRAGLMTDDKIIRIGDWPTLGKETDEIIKRLKGKPNTPVDLYIWRHGMDPSLIERPTEDMKTTVMREQVRIPPGTFQMLPGNIGLLELDEFSQVAMDEARGWIKEMLDLGMESMILDLRFNGGGLLTAAKDVAELFLPPGQLVVSTEGPDATGEVRELDRLETTASESILPSGMPLVVLVGPGTASAAEIVSGALQDHGRAQLVGKTTYGKGSVQQLIPILDDLEDEWRDTNRNRIWDPWEEVTVDHDGDGEVDYAPRVKLTVARYMLPSGRSIHRVIDREGSVVAEGGVEPDVVVDTPLIDGWRLREQRRIRPMVKEHVEQTYEQNHDLYVRLSLNDQRRPDLYPGFDELKARLGSNLSDDDIRWVLRREARRRVQDEIGAQFPLGDFVEDVQLQKAIELALGPRGLSPDDVDDFELVFDLPEPDVEGEVVLANRDSQDLQQALSLLRDARTGGRQLSGEEVDRLIEIIGTIDTRKKN